jgi:hypothetical protein
MPNVKNFARALMALHNLDLLKNEACKEPVKLFIRQATESRHWHNTAHYRSKAAADLINQQNLTTAAAYQKYCSTTLRHEHIVPIAVIYKMILDELEITLAFLEETLQRYGLRATITRDEDSMLLRNRMPKEFFQEGHALHLDPFARYIAAGLSEFLERRTSEYWINR